MAKAKPKQELVTTVNNVVNGNSKISLENTQVRFDAKISTKDLIDAVIFQKEEELVQKKKTLDKLIEKLEEEGIELEEKLSKIIESEVKKYKNKDAEDIAKKVNDFLGVKSNKVSYYGGVNENKFCVNISIEIQRYNVCAKWIDLDLPKTIKEAQDAKKKNTSELNKQRKILKEVNEQLSEVPRWKKRVQAGFVAKLVDGGLTGEQMLLTLREELEKVLKQ